MSGGKVLILPGNDTAAQINWPTCDRCRTLDGVRPIVTAYGIANETDDLVEVWVEHHGQRDGVKLYKDALWGPWSLTNALRQMAFFADGGARVIRRDGMIKRLTGRVRRARGR